jgi:pimeloyl-ACP methyl ester carboxylesterase
LSADRLLFTVHTMAVSLIFLPSPLLGPSVWRPVARILADQGWHTMVCELPDPVVTGDDVLGAFRAALPVDRDLVLVPHSNAGAYVPELSVDCPIRAAVFVDAVLPPPSGRIPLAPPALLDVLRELAGDDGLLPPWTEWWGETDVGALFPDAQSRAAVEREQQRVALAYFKGARAVPAGWGEAPGAYLAFGDTYATERDDAAQRGWPVRTLQQAGHLHQLTDPDQVAEAIRALLDEVGIAATR